MHKRNIYLIASFLIVMLACITGTSSCNKKKNEVYFGTLLSKRHNPVPNGKISFYVIQTSGINGKTTGGKTFGVTTASDGTFRGKFEMTRKEYVHQIYVSSDSGATTVYGGVQPNKEITIVLE